MTDQEKCRALAERLGWEVTLGPCPDAPLYATLGRGMVRLEPCPDFAFAVLEELARRGAIQAATLSWEQPSLRANLLDWNSDGSPKTNNYAYSDERDIPLAIINAACAALEIE